MNGYNTAAEHRSTCMLLASRQHRCGRSPLRPRCRVCCGPAVCRSSAAAWCMSGDVGPFRRPLPALIAATPAGTGARARASSAAPLRAARFLASAAHATAATSGAPRASRPRAPTPRPRCRACSAAVPRRRVPASCGSHAEQTAPRGLICHGAADGDSYACRMLRRSAGCGSGAAGVEQPCVQVSCGCGRCRGCGYLFSRSLKD